MIQLVALALTLAIEVPVALIGKRLSKLPMDSWRFALVAASTSLFTHPIVWPLITLWLKPSPFWLRATIGESFAVLIEALIYWKFTPLGFKGAFLISLAANLASFGIGLMIGGRIHDAGAALRLLFQ